MTRKIASILLASALVFGGLSGTSLAGTVSDPDTGNLLCKGAKSCANLKATCNDGAGSYQDGADNTGKCTVKSVIGGATKMKVK